MTLLVEPKPRLLSVADFLAMPESSDFELVDRELVKRKPMGALADCVAMQIGFLLTLFKRQIGGGHVFGSETFYRCFGNPRTGRRGDVSFIRLGRLPDEMIPEGEITIPADLIVEVVSPTDLAYNVEAKAKLYLDNGFSELWVVFPNTRTVHVRRSGQRGFVLNNNDTVKGDGALTGFECKVSEFFPTSSK